MALLKRMPRRVNIFFAAALTIAAVAFIACGGGQSSGASDTVAGQSADRALGDKVDKKEVLRPIQWGPVRTASRSVKIGALVGYCDNGESRPYIERVKRRRQMERVVLTMLVRFSPRTRPGCHYLQIGVEKWVKFHKDLSQLRFFDGATSPPTPRSVN